jgi:hypothetical protein
LAKQAKSVMTMTALPPQREIDRRTDLTPPFRDETSSVHLYWIPLGAGHHSVRFNGIVYEALCARIERRQRRDLYHSVLELDLPHGHYWVEMTPVPHGDAQERGVVGGGPVGLRALGQLRPFRYEIRRWRDGVVPDLDYAVASPIRVTDQESVAQRVFDSLADVPPLVWGRDERRNGDMWSCNSVISWTLARAGIHVPAVPLPAHGRAPGWAAGLAVANATPDLESSHTAPRPAVTHPAATPAPSPASTSGVGNPANLTRQAPPDDEWSRPPG